MIAKNSGRVEEGFSVVEVMVALMIGVIVLSMAVSILFSAHSSGVTLLSKQEVSSNTRTALSRILKDIGSAQTLLRCTVWKSSELQVEYDTYIRRIDNGGDDPTTQIIESGNPTFSGSSADCLEYYESGHVLLRMLPNSLCWFQDLTPSDEQIDYSKPFQTACMFRGGAGRDANYDSVGQNVGYGSAAVAPMPCNPPSGKATDEDKIYYLECSYSDSRMHYFVPNETVYGSWSLVDKSYAEILDLGSLQEHSTQMRKNIFSYTGINGAVPDYVDSQAGNNTNDILYVHVNMGVVYDTGKKLASGEKEEKLYRYAQTILLQGAKNYKDEGSYADRFTG